MVAFAAAHKAAREAALTYRELTMTEAKGLHASGARPDKKFGVHFMVHQHATSDRRIEHTVLGTYRGEVAPAKAHVRQASLAHASARKLQRTKVAVDTHHLAVRADQLRREQHDVTATASHVEHAHAGPTLFFVWAHQYASADAFAILDDPLYAGTLDASIWAAHLE